jgi:hypothetical protein
VTDRRVLGVAVVMVVGCTPFTTRPSITPLPEAAATEIRLPVQEATRQLAAALQADSIPANRVRVRDGYIETGWFDAATGRPTRRRPLGAETVRVRAWADPARPGNTLLIVETLFRPVADPSLPERELEKQVPRDHPVAVKVDSALSALLKRYGGPPSPEAQPPAAEVPAEE